MAPAPERDEGIPAHLGVGDAVSLIIGVVVGAGIFETPPLVFNNLGSTVMVLGVWALGGLLSLVGALCYAELATTYPRSGGDFVYLSRAYGPWVGFLFAWAQLAVILTSNIGMMTYVFADYGLRLFYGPAGPSVGERYGWLWAAAPVVVLTSLNILGLRAGKWTQNTLTAVKVLGLVAVIAAGLFWTAPQALTVAPANKHTDLGYALVLVFLTYGGWNDAAYVAAEVRDGSRGIPRALALGTTAILVLYVLVNLAYAHGLGYEAASQSRAVAADVLAGPLGAWGEKGMCLLVMVSALGAANGLIFTGARVCLSLGRAHALFTWLGRWHARRGSPYVALLTQAGISLAMIAVVGTPAGQETMNRLFALLHLPEVSWKGQGGFMTLVQCTAPIFWFFFLLTGQSLFLLRALDRDRPRPFPVPFFPWLPLLFCFTCSYMLISGVNFAGPLGLVGAGLLAAGVPVYLLSRSLAGAEAPPAPPLVPQEKHL